MIQKIVREPLVHFFIIGAVIFAIYYGVNREGGSPDDQNVIVITKGQIHSLKQNFRKVWSREPNKKEVNNLINELIQEEVLYREALALGLDIDDTIIRRRLRQKMEFLSNELLQLDNPSEEILQDYYEQNRLHYQTDPTFTFTQIYFNPEKHPKNLDSDIEDLLKDLSAGDSDVELSDYGDATLLNPDYEEVSPSKIKSIFGPTFSGKLNDLPVGKWIGPIESGYGVHIVKIQKKNNSITPDYEAVKEAVKNDYLGNRAKKAREATFRKVKEKYNIQIESTGD